jgi:hypothetical protein
MKIDELLKHLENIKIDENIDERHEIAKYLAQKLSDDDSIYLFYIIMMRYKQIIYDIYSYKKFLKSDKISSNDAYVYVENTYFLKYDSMRYFYPFLIDRYLLPFAYLSKQGFSYSYAVPATGLKYVSMVVRFLSVGRVVVEVADINHAAINMDLPRLIPCVLGPKRIDDYRVKEIMSRFSSQKLFAGYDFDEARDIINRYYEDHDTSLAKDVKAIRDAYIHIFRPFRIEYDLKTKRPTYIFKW